MMSVFCVDVFYDSFIQLMFDCPCLFVYMYACECEILMFPFTGDVCFFFSHFLSVCMSDDLYARLCVLGRVI